MTLVITTSRKTLLERCLSEAAIPIKILYNAQAGANSVCLYFNPIFFIKICHDFVFLFCFMSTELEALRLEKLQSNEQLQESMKVRVQTVEILGA